MGGFLDVLRDEQFLSRPLYDHAYVASAISAHIDGTRDHARLLWMLVNIELWHRVFVDRSEPVAMEAAA